jgi:tetratricopeptide (TPR) repeat protein
MAGELRLAKQLQAESLELAERLQQPFNQAYARSFAALFANLRSQFAEAVEHASIAQRVADQHGFPVWFGAATIHQSVALGCSQNPATAIPTLVHMLGLWQAGGAELSRPAVLWGLARCHAAAGDVTSALQAIDEALATAQRTSEGFILPEIYRLRGELLHARAPADSPWQDALASAVATAHSQGARLLELRAIRTLCALSPDDRAGARGARLGELLRQLRDTGESDRELDEAAAVLS